MPLLNIGDLVYSSESRRVLMVARVITTMDVPCYRVMDSTGLSHWASHEQLTVIESPKKEVKESFEIFFRGGY